MSGKKKAQYVVKYTVQKFANFQNGAHLKEWRIECTKTTGGICTREPVCDVRGTRRRALEIARTLNNAETRKQCPSAASEVSDEREH